jgi:hypothetical protein
MFLKELTQWQVTLWEAVARETQWQATQVWEETLWVAMYHLTETEYLTLIWVVTLWVVTQEWKVAKKVMIAQCQSSTN